MLHRFTLIFFNLFLAASTVIIQSTIWLQDNYLYLRELYFVKMWMSYFQMIKIRGKTIGKRLSRCRIQDFTRGFKIAKAELCKQREFFEAGVIVVSDQISIHPHSRLFFSILTLKCTLKFDENCMFLLQSVLNALHVITPLQNCTMSELTKILLAET